MVVIKRKKNEVYKEKEKKQENEMLLCCFKVRGFNKYFIYTECIKSVYILKGVLFKS